MTSNPLSLPVLQNPSTNGVPNPKFDFFCDLSKSEPKWIPYNVVAPHPWRNFQRIPGPPTDLFHVFHGRTNRVNGQDWNGLFLVRK